MRRSLGVLLLLSAGCAPDSPGASGTAGVARFAVVPKGTTHVFWKAVESGARAGAAESGVEILWKGPLQENDRAQQIQLVQQLVGAGIDGLALAPLDHAALVPAVASARARGIPVVIFDSDLDGTPGVDFASFVATDNRAAGALAGAHLAELLGGAGKALLLRYAVGSASTEAREAGFLAAVDAGGVEVVLDNRYAGATVGEAKTTALNLLDALAGAQGVFCSNESATAGMLLALEQMGLAGSVRFVGFDASPLLVEALRNGEIDAIVVQDPVNMGYQSVKQMLDHLDGKPVDPLVVTDVKLATKANMDDPAIKPLLE
jgi:ribose transport system substrate-binding protein